MSAIAASVRCDPLRHLHKPLQARRFPVFARARGPTPGDLRYCSGGSSASIVPSKSLVLVRLGLGDEGDAGWKALGAWIAEVVHAFPDTKGA